MDIARGGDIEPCSTNHWRWEALVVSIKIYDQLNDSTLPCACDQVLTYIASFHNGTQTCLAYK